MAATTTTRFHNHSDAALVDLLGEVTTQRAELGEAEKALKEELRRRGVERAAGERFLVWIERDTAWLLDITAVRAEMGEAWCTRRSRVSPRARVRVRPAAAANDDGGPDAA